MSWLLDPDKPQKKSYIWKSYGTKNIGKVEITSALYTQNNFLNQPLISSTLW